MVAATVAVLCHNRPEIGQSVADGLSQRGLDAQVLPDGADGALAADVVLLVGGPSSLRRTIGAIERAGPARPRVAAWLFEPLPPPEITLPEVRRAVRYSAIRTGRRWMRPIMRLLSRPHDSALARRLGRDLTAGQLRFFLDTASFAFRGTDRGWLDATFVSTLQKQRQLAGWGIASEFLPVGQQPAFGRDLDGPRDIDLLFIGSRKDARRRRTLDAILAAARARGLSVHVPEAPIWGEDRTRLVNRARVLLHLHQFDWDTPWMRWMLAAANGAVVAGEPLSVPDPMRPGVDYLEAPTETLVEEIARLVADEPRRRRMLDDCRARIAATMTQESALDRLAERLTALAASGGGR